MPFDQAERLHAALTEVGVGAEFHAIKGGCHNWNARPDPTVPNVQFWELEPLGLSFFQRHLGSGETRHS